MDREKVIKALECCERTDGEQCKNCPYTDSDICVEEMSKDALALLKEQERIIKQYQKADGFLFAHGWKWEDYIDTQEEPHPIEVGEDGLPY